MVDVQPRPKADLEDASRQAFGHVGSPLPQAARTAGPVDQVGEDLLAIEAHCRCTLIATDPGPRAIRRPSGGRGAFDETQCEKRTRGKIFASQRGRCQLRWWPSRSTTGRST